MHKKCICTVKWLYVTRLVQLMKLEEAVAFDYYTASLIRVDVDRRVFSACKVQRYIFSLAHRFWKLICLHLPTDCFIEISLQSTGHWYTYELYYISLATTNSFALFEEKDVISCAFSVSWLYSTYCTQLTAWKDYLHNK